MKPFVIFLLVLALGLSACKDDRVSSFEKRVTDLETKMKSIEDSQKAKSDADSTNEANFKGCILDADNDFDNNLRNNGTKTRTGYSVPTPVLEQMQRQRQSRYEECKLLYK